MFVQEEDYPNVSKAVGRAVSSLCRSVKYGQVPPDIELMATYLQYVQDLEQYTEKCRTYAEELRSEQERLVQDAMVDFRHQTRLKREAYVWDWCPIWTIVSENKYVFEKLPPLPWCHDGKSWDWSLVFLQCFEFLLQGTYAQG